MSEILRFEDGVHKRIAREIINQMGSWEINAVDNANSFSQLLIDNPRQAIKRISEFIAKARDSEGPESHVYEAYTGGANESWTAPILDLVGVIYPILPQDVRKEALTHSLGFLDTQKYPIAQDNVERIDEPWLVGDIITNRPLYWCGFAEYCGLLQEHKSWGEVFKTLESGKIKSAFWMSMAVAWRDCAADAVRENYPKFFPTLMDRTKDAIAAMTMVKAQNEFLQEGTSLKEAVERRLVRYDPQLIPDIRRKIQEAKWVDLDEAVYIKEFDPIDGYWKHRSKIKTTYSPKPAFLTLVK